MRTRLRFLIRSGFLIAACALLAGCAMDMLPYQPAASLEQSVQAVLARQGYYQGPVDGTVGPMTRRAIGAYQRDHGLTPTGTINTALVASMGLAAPVQAATTYYPAYPSYAAYPAAYAYPAVYPSPAVINVGLGNAWPAYRYGGFWGNGYRGFNNCGYPGNYYRGGYWGGNGYRAYNNGYRGYNQGWHR